MKNTVRLIGILAITVLVGFGFWTCDDGGGPSELKGTVSITGTAEVGQTLSVNTSSLNGSGTITYQWIRSGSTIIGSGSTYILLATDVGSTITVTVTRFDNSGSITSSQTATVINSNLPALTGTISINGTAQVGQTLTANTTSLGGCF